MKKNKVKTKNENRGTIMKTIKFMLSVAWKERPSLYLVYAMLFVAELIGKFQFVVLPKFLIDELMLILDGGSAAEHIRTVVFYVVLICGSNLLKSVMNNVAYQWKSVLEEWFNEYFETMLAEHTMKMDFEYTEDPKALEQLNRAKEGIGWYSGGVVGILNSVYDMISHVTVLLGVTTIITLTCPLLLPVQFIGLLLISLFNSKKNKVDIERYSKFANVNRVFGYYLFQLADFSYGKEIRLYDSADMMLCKAREEGKSLIRISEDAANRQRTCLWGMDIVNATRDGVSYFYIVSVNSSLVNKFF